MAPRLQLHEKTPNEKSENRAEEVQKREILGPPPFGPPPLYSMMWIIANSWRRCVWWVNGSTHWKPSVSCRRPPSHGKAAAYRLSNRHVSHSLWPSPATSTSTHRQISYPNDFLRVSCGSSTTLPSSSCGLPTSSPQSDSLHEQNKRTGPPNFRSFLHPPQNSFFHPSLGGRLVYCARRGELHERCRRMFQTQLWQLTRALQETYKHL